MTALPATPRRRVRDDSTLTTIDDGEFVQMVAATSDEELAETMRGGLREDILDEIFARMQQHLRPCRAAGVDAVVAWKICGRPGRDCYEMQIRDGACEVRECCAERPDVTLSLDPVALLKLVSGNARGPALMLRGRLRAGGDIRLARRLEGMFALPQVVAR